MITKYTYPIHGFPFHKVVQKIFNCDNLMLLHEQLTPQGETRNFDFQPGFDQSTIFHKKFYEAIERDPEFLDMYRLFVRTYIVGSLYEGDLSKYLVQKIPTFRVHLPNNKAVGGRSHRDADYNHPHGEVNFLVPLTSMEGSSSLFIESSPGMKDFHFVSAQPGQFLRFNGNLCEHGNIPNVTGWTRVSFDFRIISREDLDKTEAGRSVAQGIRFVEGEYYEAL